MSFFKAKSFLQLVLPFRVRLTVMVFCFLLCCMIVAAGMWFTHYSSFATLFALPVIMAGWGFKQRGAFICVVGVLVVLAVINTLVTGTLFWPPSLLFGFAFGGLGFFIVGVLVGLLAQSLELSQSARLKAEQAEERQQQLNEIRNQFLLNVSHELRTPLTQLQGYLELLYQYRERLDTSTQLRFLQQALRGCEELHLLVRNVLDAAQATYGIRPPQSEAVLVAEAVQDVLSQVDPEMRESYSIHLDIPESLALWADPQYLRQVLRNLLSNAFKYTPRQTNIVISAALEESKGLGASNMVRLCVKDAGMGIPPAEIPLLFEKFVRLQRDMSGSKQGTGLGLYISKQVVEAMGGRIWVESTGVPGQGSCFCFTLPHAPFLPQEGGKASPHDSSNDDWKTISTEAGP